MPLSSKQRQDPQDQYGKKEKRQQGGTTGRDDRVGREGGTTGLGWDNRVTTGCNNRVGQQGGTTGWEKHGAGMHRLVTAYKGKIKVHRGSGAVCHAVFNWCA